MITARNTNFLTKLICLATVAFVGQVYAQMEEIIVTAAKREQTLQEVPVAVSVVSEAVIDRAHIEDMFDLQGVVPSFEARQYQSSHDATFFIRGYGNGSNNPGIEPSVAMYVDGVYRSRMQSQLMDLPNLQRVEILKGPQSTIFGKNSSAGVINIVTKKPSQDFEGKVKTEVGDYSARKFQAYVNGGLTDAVAASLSVTVNKRDGYSETIFNENEDVNDTNRKSARADIFADLSDTLTMRLIYDYSDVDEICCTVGNTVGGQFFAAARALGASNEEGNPFTYKYSPNYDPENKVKNRGLSVHLEKDLGFATLTSITSDRRSDNIATIDISFDSADMFAPAPKVIDLENFSQEFRLTSNGDERLDWQIGALYSQEDLYHEFRLTYGPLWKNYIDLLAGGNGSGGVIDLVDSLLAPIGYPGGSFGAGQGTLEVFTQDNKSLSIFAQVEFEVTEKLTATVGVSYFEDEKTVTMEHTNTARFSQLDLVQIGYQGALAGYLGQVSAQVTQGYLAQATAGFLAQAVPQYMAAGLSEEAATAAATPDAEAFAASQTAAAQAFAQSQLPLYMDAAMQFASAASTDPTQNQLLAFQPLQVLPGKVGFPNAGFDGLSDDNNVDYSVKLSYELNDQVTLYGGIATGYKASQFNLSRDSAPSAAEVAAITQAGGVMPANLVLGLRNANPEEGEVIEVGAKMLFEKGSLNITYFDQTVEDFVSNTFVGAGFVLSNAGEQSAKGLEFDLLYSPTENLDLALSGMFIDSKYDSFVGSAAGDISGQDVEGVHPESLSASITWNWEANSLSGYARVHYQHDSNVVIRPEPGANELLAVNGHHERSRGLLNASIGVERNGWEMTLWGRNLTNDEFLITAFPAVGTQQTQWSGYPNEPRMWGLSLSKQF